MGPTGELELEPGAVVSKTTALLEEELRVTVLESRSGRVTGWRVRCPDHGEFPIEARTKDQAVRVGARHVMAEHGGRGKVRIRRAR